MAKLSGNSVRQLPEIDDADILIVRGASSTDDLVMLGLLFAERYQRASSVVLISEKGPPRTVKGDPLRVCFVDATSPSSRIAGVFDRIYAEVVRSDPEAERHAHEVVARFLFYTMIDEEPLVRRMVDLISDGDVGLLEKCAEQFIDSGFGAALVRLSLDGDGSNAAVAGRRGGSAASGEAPS